MALSAGAAPAVEPVTLAELKRALRVTWAEEDGHLALALAAARDYDELETGRRLITRTQTLRLAGFPAGPIVLPWAPCAGVTSISYLDTAGDAQAWAATEYVVTAPTGDLAWLGSVQPVVSGSYPTTYGGPASVTVEYTAGYGAAASDVPVGLRMAVMAAASQWYDDRSGVSVRRPPQADPYIVRDTAAYG